MYTAQEVRDTLKRQVSKLENQLNANFDRLIAHKLVDKNAKSVYDQLMANSFEEPQAKPKPLKENDRLIRHETLKKELEKSVEQLKLLLEMMEIRNNSMKSKTTKLKTENNVEVELINKMKEHIDVEQKNNGKNLDAMKKTKVIDKYIQDKSQSMFHFINKHFPLPGEREIKIAKQISFNKSQEEEEQQKVISMIDTVELLISSWQKNRLNPWVDIESACLWSPYVELLLRFNIVERHPQKSNLIAIISYV